MAYVPPSCDAVNFNIIGKFINIPACNAVNFNLVGTVDLGILSGDLVLPIVFEPFYWAQGYFVQCHDLVLKIYADDATFQTLSEIESEDAVLKIISDTGILRILPDCISEDLVIKTVFDIAEMKRSEPQDLPIKLAGGLTAPYETPTIVDEHIIIPWGDGIKTDNNIIINNGEFNNVDEIISDGWGKLEFADDSIIITNNDTSYFADHSVDLPWKSLFIADKINEIVYGDRNEINQPLIIPYRQPGPKDKTQIVDFDFLETQNLTYVFPWNSPGPQDKHQLVPWGPINYFSFCSSKYWPPTDGIVNFKISPNIPWTLQEPTLIGACHGIVFDVDGLVTDLRCPYQHYRTGHRDSNTDTTHNIVNPLYPAKSKEVYYMLNTVYAQTVITSTPLEILSVSAVIDKQSWLWQYDIVVGSDTALELVKPVVNSDGSVTFIDIEISINGWKFTCTVESWSENLSFGRGTWNIKGRSPSLVLGAPQNAPTSYIYNDTGYGLSGGSIIEAVLHGQGFDDANTGWEVDWSFYNNVPVGKKMYGLTGFDPTSGADWGIPDGVFSWTDKTQIEVIKQLIDEIGAYILTVPDCKTNKKLVVKPKYGLPPWHWATNSTYKLTDADIDHKINTAVCREIGRSFASLPTYNAVYVMGQTTVAAISPNPEAGAILVDVYRDGVGPGERVYAPNVIGQYLTSVLATAETGRSIICETGEWVNHTLSIFSLKQYESADEFMIGLVVPGDFIQVTENTKTWFGLVNSVNLSVSMASGAACAVVQTIEVSEYIGTKSIGT